MSFTPTLATILLFAALGLVPLLLMVGTSFVKASVVLSLLRNALGASSVPSGAVVAALAALLTVYVMAPIARQATEAAQGPLDRLDFNAPLGKAEQALLLEALTLAKEPLRIFLERNSGAQERALFVDLAKARDAQSTITASDFLVVLPAFLITELKEALQIGFLLLLPFLIVDLALVSVLASLGMTSVSPSTVALPLKLLLFLSVDGFSALSRALVTGYV